MLNRRQLIGSAAALTAAPAAAAKSATVAPVASEVEILEEHQPSAASPLFYREKGSGQPVVFVHSYLLDSRHFLDQLNGLSDNYHCLAPDLRGHGQSTAEIRRDIKEEDDAKDIIGFIRAKCGGQPAHIVGFSGGGIISALVYKQAPELVKSLTLLSTNFIAPLDKAYKRYQAELARLAVVDGIDTVFRRFDEYIVGSGADLMARARYKTMLSQQPYELVVSFLTSDAIQARPDLPAQLDLPVFLPFGGEDPVMGPDLVKKLLNLYPNASTASVPKAGRLLPLENPEALNSALLKFWRNL